MAARRGQTKSEVIRHAIVRFAQEAGEPLSAYHRLQPFIGIIDGCGRRLSADTGRRFRELLEKRRRARRWG